MKACANRLAVIIVAALLVLAAPQQSLAGSATWQTNPSSGDWYDSTNWMPNTVPDGAGEVATFGSSDVTDLTIHATSVEVSEIIFGPDAEPFAISVAVANILFTGVGIINDSGSIQTFLTPVTENNDGNIFFFDHASAGELTSFVGVGGGFIFLDSSSAGLASFDVSNTGSFVGEVGFFDTATAANSTISVNNRGNVVFGDSATAADAVITATSIGDVLFGTSSRAGNAVISLSGDSHASFTQSATADHSHFTAQGAASSSEPGAIINIGDSATAGEATFILEGGSVAGAPGAELTFFNSGKAGNAAITVKGGTNSGLGASVLFQAESDGGTASLSIFGNGKVDFSRHDPGVVTLGSVAGDGQMTLGGTASAVGSNDQNTIFSGLIEDGSGNGGSLSKVGTGTLKLSGANTYSGGTTIAEGTLAVGNATGSATGRGPVQVSGGTLAGRGVIAGSVTVGSGSGAGAVLAPSQGAARPTTLTLQSSLTFKSGGSCRYRLNLKKGKSDLVVAHGVTIESGAQLNLQAISRGRVRPGKVATVINNTAATPIEGTFANLPEGATLSAGGNTLQATYHGGDGNDFTLTVVP